MYVVAVVYATGVFPPAQSEGNAWDPGNQCRVAMKSHRKTSPIQNVGKDPTIREDTTAVLSRIDPRLWMTQMPRMTPPTMARRSDIPRIIRVKGIL
jgi:hypothetical protein